ncbi:MAG: glycoside hydrolase 43 family protein [bacterium]
MASKKLHGARAVLALMLFVSVTGTNRASAQAAPDVARGQYRNPIIFADYSDPDVIRVGEDFYMTASSFGAVPALPILHSRDLVHWRIVNHAIRRLGPDFDVPQHGNGVWAPSIRYHDGSYFIYYGDPDRGIFMVKSDHPDDAWDPPVLVKAAKGWIDPCPLWDDDGNAYLVHAFANSRAGIKSVLHVNRMSRDGTHLLDEGTLVFDGHAHHPTIEGPKFYKRGGWYYIFAPAGGVSTGWQTVLRSRNVLGPYEDRIVLTQGRSDVNGPHQGAWVSLANGDDWFVHFQDRDAYGRIVHLQPMKWRADDWPVIGDDADGDGTGEPVLASSLPSVGRSYPSLVPQTSDEFDTTSLGLQWQWQGNDQPSWSSLRRGLLRLIAQPLPSDSANLWSVPSLLLQKLPAPSFTATTSVRVQAGDAKAGLVVFGMDYAYVALRRRAGANEIVYVRVLDAPSGAREQELASAPVAGPAAQLRVVVADGAMCQFQFSTTGSNWISLGEPFKAQKGRWVGAKVGLFVRRDGDRPSYADFDFFRVTQ